MNAEKITVAHLQERYDYRVSAVVRRGVGNRTGQSEASERADPADYPTQPGERARRRSFADLMGT